MYGEAVDLPRGKENSSKKTNVSIWNKVNISRS